MAEKYPVEKTNNQLKTPNWVGNQFVLLVSWIQTSLIKIIDRNHWQTFLLTKYKWDSRQESYTCWSQFGMSCWMLNWMITCIATDYMDIGPITVTQHFYCSHQHHTILLPSSSFYGPGLELDNNEPICCGLLLSENVTSWQWHQADHLSITWQRDNMTVTPGWPTL